MGGFPKLWHDSYREQGVDFHVWVHDTLPADPARFMSEHVAFTRAQLSSSVLPTEEYHFLYLFPDRDVRHGVEHEDSTVIALGPAERVNRRKATWKSSASPATNCTTLGTSNAFALPNGRPTISPKHAPPNWGTSPRGDHLHGRLVLV